MGKVLITSTPGTRGACRITQEFETRSDRRLYHAWLDRRDTPRGQCEL
jgi:hypothetical protein